MFEHVPRFDKIFQTRNIILNCYNYFFRTDINSNKTTFFYKVTIKYYSKIFKKIIVNRNEIGLTCQKNKYFVFLAIYF